MAKAKLRELSRRKLSAEDYGAVVEQLESPDVPDMVAAILGARGAPVRAAVTK